MPANTDVVDRLEHAGQLDPVIGAVRRIVDRALGSQRIRDALHGVWLGHPLHPPLTDVPIGAWTAAAVLDTLPGNDVAAASMIAVGCAAYVPTVLAGWADWSDLHERQQRVGLVHAASGAVAFGCYTASLAARARGSGTRGKAWSYLGLACVAATGYLGGHLAFRQAAGANRAEAIPRLFPDGWHDIGQLDGFPEAELALRSVAGVELVVVRRGRHVDVLADTCSHLGASLSDGSFAAEEGQGCVVCPWHGSTFRLSDGAVVHGPATAPVPAFVARLVDGQVEVMLRDAD